MSIEVLPCPLRADVRALADEWAAAAAAASASCAAPRDLIVCCSRLSKEKNVELFVDLVCHARVRDAMRALGVQPCLVGASVDAAYASVLTERLRAAHPASEVHDFMGAPSLALLFQRACLYVHSSLNESFGMTICEASAFAAPPLMHAHSIGAGELYGDDDAIKVDLSAPLDGLAECVGMDFQLAIFSQRLQYLRPLKYICFSCLVLALQSSLCTMRRACAPLVSARATSPCS